MRKLAAQWRDVSFEKKLATVAMPILLAVLSGLVLPLLSKQADELGEKAPPPPAAQLEVVDVVVTGGEPAKCLDDEPVPQRVDVTVRNVGKLVAIVKRAGLRVRAFGAIMIPQAGGGLAPSEDYDVLLPPEPRIGEVVDLKVSQQVRPNTADRFTIRVDVPEPARQEGERLYQLEVLLYHDAAAQPIDAGLVLVSAPHLPDARFFRAGNPWTAGQPDSPAAHTIDENEKTYRRMIALPGERAAALTSHVVDQPVADERPQNPCVSSGGGS